jgi:transcriptional regulator with XRE-family HTH domain
MLTQKQLGVLVGLSQQSISKLQLGQMTLRPDRAKKVAQKVGCDWTVLALGDAPKIRRAFDSARERLTDESD